VCYLHLKDYSITFLEDHGFKNIYKVKERDCQLRSFLNHLYCSVILESTCYVMPHYVRTDPDVFSVQVVDTAVQAVLLVVLLARLLDHDCCGLDGQYLDWIAGHLLSG
jgi:hypothetical protein